MATIYIATFVVMLIAVIAMAVGVIFGRPAIKGSCGGLNNIKGLEGSCSVCSVPCKKRRKALEKMRSN